MPPLNPTMNPRAPDVESWRRIQAAIRSAVATRTL
jgi:hypothetical protein